MCDPRTKKFETLFTEENGKFRCTIRGCDKSYVHRNHLYNHVRKEHPLAWEKVDNPSTAVLSQNEEALLNEFDELGIPEGVKMMGREYYLLHDFQVDNDTSKTEPDFSYELLTPLVHLPNHPEADKNKQNTFGTDHLLQSEFKLPLEEYRKDKLPKGTEMGHKTAKKNYMHSIEKLKKTLSTSAVSIQDTQLNEVHFARTEDIARELTKLGKVHDITGTEGTKSVIKQTRLNMAEFWYKLLINYDPIIKLYCYDAWRFPNEPCKENLEHYRVEIEELQRHTGYNFCHKICNKMIRVDFDSKCKTLDFDLTQQRIEMRTENDRLTKENEEIKEQIEEIKEANEALMEEKEYLQDEVDLLRNFVF